MTAIDTIEDKHDLIESLVWRKLSRYRAATGLADRAQVSAYRNRAVVDNYLSTRPEADREEAEALFVAMLPELYHLAAAVREGRPPVVAMPDRVLDMWDAFVLCTRPYWNFCEHYLGGYLHRNPGVHGEGHPLTRLRPRKTIASLDEVMAYRNPTLVDGFHTLYDVTRAEAEELFEEICKWLWLCGQSIHERAPQIRVDNDLLMLDEMWHLFILFSDAYVAFCNRYFGFYIHHQPTTYEEKKRFRERLHQQPSDLLSDMADEERSFYTYVYEKLGRDTLIKWHTESSLFA